MPFQPVEARYYTFLIPPRCERLAQGMVPLAAPSWNGTRARDGSLPPANFYEAGRPGLPASSWTNVMIRGSCQSIAPIIFSATLPWRSRI